MAIFYKLRKKLGREPLEAEVITHQEEKIRLRKAKDAQVKRDLRLRAKSDPELDRKLKECKRKSESGRMARVRANPERLKRHTETRLRLSAARRDRINSDPVLKAMEMEKTRILKRKNYAARRANEPEFAEHHRKRIRTYFSDTENGRRLRRETMSRRRKESPEFRMAGYIRSRIAGVLRGKEKFGRSGDLIGCSMDEYKSYLEALFKHGMTWENFGKLPGCWSVDHKVPIAAHDISTEAGQKTAFHYTNTEPVWHIENITKSSIYNGKRWYYRDHIKTA